MTVFTLNIFAFNKVNMQLEHNLILKHQQDQAIILFTQLQPESARETAGNIGNAAVHISGQ